MPRLLLLNGLPGVGKSTLARRYAADHPMALVLDVDVVRGLLGRWRADPHRAGLLAREVALAGARAHLGGGHDVVVPQLVAREPFLLALDRLAADTGSRFDEVVLDADVDELADRLRRRTERGERPEHDDAAHLLGAGGATPDGLAATRDRLEGLLAGRPGAVRVAVVPGDVEATWLRLGAALRTG